MWPHDWTCTISSSEQEKRTLFAVDTLLYLSGKFSNTIFFTHILNVLNLMEIPESGGKKSFMLQEKYFMSDWVWKADIKMKIKCNKGHGHISSFHASYSSHHWSHPPGLQQQQQQEDVSAKKTQLMSCWWTYWRIYHLKSHMLFFLTAWWRPKQSLKREWMVDFHSSDGHKHKKRSRITVKKKKK